MKLEISELKRYLQARQQRSVHLLELRPIDGQETGNQALKQFGYGRPLDLARASALAAYQLGKVKPVIGGPLSVDHAEKFTLCHIKPAELRILTVGFEKLRDWASLAVVL